MLVTDLADMAAGLSLTELDDLLARLQEARLRRVVPALTNEETDLLRRINDAVPSEMRARYRVLRDRSAAGQLGASEREELTLLVDQVEGREAERIGFIARLAALRGTTAGRLLEEMGLRPRDWRGGG